MSAPMGELPGQLPIPESSTDEQRWTIFELFGQFGIKDVSQMRADAARILQLDDGLADMRSLTRPDADELIGELRRALAKQRVSND
jgi:hypothetical protein